MRFLGAGPDPRGGFTFSFGEECEGLIHIIAEHMYEMMGMNGPHPLNCVQIEIKPRDFQEDLVLTLQRSRGKTPLRLKAEAVKLLQQTLEAIDTGRSEPLFIMRDSIRNWLADQPASAIEAGTDETRSGSAEGESAIPKGDAQ